MNHHIDLDFADGEYRFALTLDTISELQRKCDGDGIGLIYARVLAGRQTVEAGGGHPGFGQYKQQDLRETIRLGLIGGNHGLVGGEAVKVPPLRAKELVEAYVSRAENPLVMPLKEQWDLAASILFATVEGYDPSGDDDDNEDDEAKKKVKTESSTSQPL